MQSPQRVVGAGPGAALVAGNFSEQEDLQRLTSRSSVAKWQFPLTVEERLREAVLSFFCDPLPVECARLQGLSLRQWKPLVHWLDVSGVALYFLERITELELCEQLPAEVLSRLQQNLEDNIARTDAMIAEAAILHREFQEAGLSYVIMKGFSLWPISVPRLELRSQLDLDFLIASSSAPQAATILGAKGYHLRAISGKSWEFKTNPVGVPTIKDLYKAKPHRTVELHLEAPGPLRDSRLARAEKRLFRDICMPVLEPADLFLGQGMHLFKHISSSSFRTSHLIEFRRHVRARHHDDRFWMQLRSLAERNPRAPIGLGVTISLISQVLGDFAPKALTSWTVDCLPPNVRLWVELYGRKLTFYGFPGSKLNLLLQQELKKEGLMTTRSLTQELLPRRLPHVIMHRTPGETPLDSIRRYRRQISFIWLRLRFHVVGGLRYLRELPRWRKQIALMQMANHQEEGFQKAGKPG